MVAEVGESGGRLYLNFDKDWCKDFTILMERKDGKAFKAAGIDPKALAGRSSGCGAGSNGVTDP